MNDPEFIELRKRFTLGLVVAIIFCVPFLFFITKKFVVETSPIIKGINKEETMLVFVEKSNCSDCKIVENRLKDFGIKYYTINTSIDRDYKTILKKLDITTTDIDEPTLMYIEEGKFYAAMVSIKSEEEVTSFLLNYGFIEN